MSARRHPIQLAGFSCGGKDLLLRVPKCDVQFGDFGLEFRSPFSLPLWIELQVELSTGVGSRPSVRQGVVVVCEPAGRGSNRVALLFLDGKSDGRAEPSANSRDN
jgi:hypothetical protein